MVTKASTGSSTAADGPSISKTERRRAAKTKKKMAAMAEKKRRQDKREQMKANRREKNEMKKRQDQENQNGCWICGDTTHRKQDCTQAFMNKSCFHCRRKGHDIHSCPQRTGGAQENKDMCFNCGENGHSLWKCPHPKKGDGTSFAQCFVCQGTGHLSSRCPMSENGIYPKGGCCKICESKMHLARDCPDQGKPLNNKKVFQYDDEDQDDAVSSGQVDSKFSGDILDEDENESKNSSKPSTLSKQKPKTVKF